MNTRNRRNRTSAGLRAASVLGVVSALTLGTAVSANASSAEIRATQPVSTSTLSAVAAGEYEYRQARDAIQRALQQQASETAVVQQAGSSLGSRFGLEVFRVIADTGASWALDEILRELGYGDDIAGDLASIYASIGALSEQVEQIHEKIEELLDESDRSEYRAAYRTSQAYVNDTDLAATLVNGWLRDGVTPSDTLVEHLMTVLTTAVVQLQDNLNNPTSGTIPWMMKAAERSAASDLQDYWADIDTARDDYRAALAQALATLDVMTQWDTEDGMVRSALTSVTPRAQDAVLRTYEAGVGYPQNTSSSSRYVQVQGQEFITVNLNYGNTPPPPQWPPWPPGFPGPFQASTSWEEIPTTRSELEPWLQAMAARYVPTSDNGPQTLEELLRASGIPTRYDFADTYHMHYRVVPGTPWSIGYSETTITSLEGYIEGNSYRTRTITHVDKARDWSRYGSEQRRDELAAKAMPARVKQATVTTNAAKRAAIMDPDTAREAAFGS